jgi:hypothetical protein
MLKMQSIRILKPMGKYSEKQAKKYLKVGLIFLIPFLVLFVTSIKGLPLYRNWGTFEMNKGFLMGIFSTFGTIIIMLPYKTWKSGINGEKAVIKNLSDKLSGEYSIFNNVLLADGKRRGDIDHLIVGPTGIFVLETKNNKETVNYNGYNWSGITKNPATQVESNAFRLKDLLKRCNVFATREPYVHAIIVFSNKKIKLKLSNEANLKWSKVLKISNQSDKSLSDYITNRPLALTPSEIEQVEQFIRSIIANYEQPL